MYKEEPGKDLLVMGSGELAQTLMEHNLVDWFVLLIYPLVLGTGRKLFKDGSSYSTLQLADIKTTPNGVVITAYQPAK